MIQKEGLCPNCGSLLQLDSQAEKGHCLFCDAVFANSDAFQILANPQGVKFPNLPQPKYDGPNLDVKPAVNYPIPKSTESTTVKKTPAKQVQPAYIPRETLKIPNVVVPLKLKLQITAIVLVIIVLIAGVSVPLLLSRNANRSQLLAVMTEISPFAVDAAQAVVIHGQQNDTLLIAAAAAVSQADAVTLFQNYCEKRASVQAIASQDFRAVYRPVTVRIVTPAGGWLIERPADATTLSSGSAVVALP